MSRHPFRALKSLLGALSVAVALSACGGTTDDHAAEVVPGQALSVASTGGLAVGSVRLDGDQVKRGTNVFLVAFDPAATVALGATTFMPVHGHGSVTPSLAREGDGYRISNVLFNMPGLWEVRLELDVGGKSDRLVFNADAP
jgi:hypothetical protein